ncbi:MAG: hypothetical protein IJ600_08685 [Lachnospiraceae bacterium]|nr:hypothetical protein [Lachnospiraceae bacterium]
MGLFAKLKQKWENWYYRDFEDEPGDWEEIEPTTENVSPEARAAYFKDVDTRTVYVLENMGQMAEAAEKMEQCQGEYNAVTDLLTDMEEIEALPKDVRVQIMDLAGKIESLEKERRQVYLESGHLAETRVKLLERYEDEVPDGIKKIREAEEYRRLVKMDMKKMEAERNSCRYQMREAVSTVSNSRGVAVICAVAMVLSIVLLVVLQMAYRMDVTWGYLLIGGAGALTLTVLFVRYQDAVRDIRRLEKVRNKTISLQNTVKIRYINNTNLLSYLYMKYSVDSADELEADWETYINEMNARAKDEKLKEELEYYYNKLTGTLKDLNIRDPEIWTRQTQALLDPREMVEVRHALIIRRQKLRERLEYNREIAEKAQKKIKDLAQAYPQYSQEIASIVKRYEGAG